MHKQINRLLCKYCDQDGKGYVTAGDVAVLPLIAGMVYIICGWTGIMAWLLWNEYAGTPVPDEGLMWAISHMLHPVTVLYGAVIWAAILLIIAGIAVAVDRYLVPVYLPFRERVWRMMDYRVAECPLKTRNTDVQLDKDK